MHGLTSALQGAAEGIDIGRTMAFYDNTAQPQQRRTVIAAIIDAVAQAIQYRFGQQTGAQRQHIALELVAHHAGDHLGHALRSEEHTSELQSLMRIPYAVFCLTKTQTNSVRNTNTEQHT